MIRAFQWDLARQVERLDFLQRLLPRYAAWGYQELYLHLEDAVHYPSLPGIGREDAYRYEELGELVLAAARVGIRVVPIVNLLGHARYLVQHRDYRELSELHDERGRALESSQLCPLHPRTLRVAEALLRDMAPYCTAGKVHVGLDESYHLGRCPRCRAEVERLGLGGHFAAHVGRLHEVARRLDLQLGFWADMLYFVPEAIPQLPAGTIAYDWYYYPFGRLPRVELFNYAERDLATPLRKQGIAYYGCPMNGAFRHEPLPVFGDRLGNLGSWWRRCQAVAAEGFLVTSWEAYRLALETTTVVDAAAACLWLDPEVGDHTTMLARGLERVWGANRARETARQLLAADEHAFAGYARWQINDRWDVFAGTESLRPYERSRAFYRKLAAQPAPAALAASLAFRRYLAERDVFVWRAAREVFRWRRQLARGTASKVKEAVAAARLEATAFARQLRQGQRAARAMWRRTRDPGRSGQNDRLLEADAERLAGWRRWLAQAARFPEIIRQATPLAGAWQLQLQVHNLTPAVQKLVVEQQEPDGSWRELASRFTLEFRAVAARPATRLKREFTVPVTGPTAKLRLGLRGVGQLAVSHVAVTDGVTVLRARDWARHRRLGRPAPRSGWPEINWTVNQATWVVPLA